MKRKMADLFAESGLDPFMTSLADGIAAAEGGKGPLAGLGKRNVLNFADFQKKK